MDRLGTEPPPLLVLVTVRRDGLRRAFSTPASDRLVIGSMVYLEGDDLPWMIVEVAAGD